MQNGNWVDGHSDVKINGTDNWSTTCASDMCLYLLDHPGWDPNFMTDVPKLLKWAEDNFVNVSTPDGLAGQYYGAYVPAEQTAYMYRMGYQTARLGAQYAQWYAVSGDATYKDRAYRCLSYNTYMMQANGQSSDGPTDTVGYWWSDCYGEATRMYYYGLGAVPEWAPPDENHLLRSSSVVTLVNYATNAINYTTFDDGSTETLRIAFTPANVFVNGASLPQRSDLSQPGWVFTASNGVLRIRHDTGANVQIVAGSSTIRLNSITVTPANSTILSGISQQFTAIGNYSDGSAQNLTSQATWTSSNTGMATINAAGLATGGSAGATTISAALAGVTGSTVLTVQSASLAIGTTSLPNGVMNVAYTTTLTASGGTLPYTWSVAGGSLPPGLTLSPNSGAISGTPTAAGTFSFKVQVRDAGNPIQTATKSLSLVIAIVSAPAVATMATIWPSTTMPGLVDGGPDSAVELGVKFRSDVAGTITGIRFYKATANTGTHVGNLWTSTGMLLATADLHQRDRIGVAAGALRHAGGNRLQYGLRGLVSCQRWTLQCRCQLLPNKRRGQSAAARAGRRRVGWQWGLCLRGEQHLPQPDLQCRQLLGGCGVRVWGSGFGVNRLVCGRYACASELWRLSGNRIEYLQYYGRPGCGRRIPAGGHGQWRGAKPRDRPAAGHRAR